MFTIRDSIPVEDVLRAYMEETQEKDTEVTEREEVVSEEVEDIAPDQSAVPTVEPTVESGKTKVESSPEEAVINVGTNISESPDVSEPETSGVKFSDKDEAVDTLGVIETIEAPKTLERLEEIEKKRAAEEAAEMESEKISIGDDISLQPLDIQPIRAPSPPSESAPALEFDSLPPL